MPCDLETIQSAACLSGIGREQSKIKLLQLIAQLTCEAGEGGGGGGDLPSGAIMMWYGTIATIPSGWAFCDGANGTPDLRNRFPVAASMDDGGVAVTTIDSGGGGIPSQSGGNVAHGHNILDPGHAHTWSAEPQATTFGGDEFDLPIDGGVLSNTTGITVQPTTNVPPYYALAFIMKL
jgi:hypothetical protein